MFNGKKERLLEEELQKVKKQRTNVTAAIEKQNAVIADQIKKSAISAAKIAGNLKQLEENLTQVGELAEGSEAAASDIHGAMVKINNVIDSFDANHTIFVGKIKVQNEKQQDLLKRQKEIMPLLEQAGMAPEKLSDSFAAIQDLTEQMSGFSKNMGVMALNAAIEAGRMGESGRRFINAAEEIRAFSEQYEAAAREVAKQLDNCREEKNQLKKQIDTLKKELQGQLDAEQRVQSERVQDMSDYERGQLQLHGIMQDSMVGRSDALLQSEREIVRMKEHMALAVANAKDELGEIEDSEEELLDASKAVSAAMLG